MRRIWDALVVGAGPAGAAAALHLARRGRTVALIDRQRFPRDKACGDALIPDALRCLRRIGLYECVRAAGHAMHEASAFGPSRDEVRIRTEFITIPRKRFDALLVDAATDAGAVFGHGRVTGLALESDCVRVDFRDGGSRRGKFVLVATGADVSLLKPLGAVREEMPTAVAIRRYVTSNMRLNRPVISFDRAILPGYAWIFPVGAREYNIGCGVPYRSKKVDTRDLRTLLDRFLAEFPLARKMSDNAGQSSRIRGARLRCGLGGVQPLSQGRILAVGETLATTFPFTGEGIGKAMETAEVAGECIHAALESGRSRYINAYPARVEELRSRYRGYHAAERWMAHPRIADFIVGRAGRSRRLRGLLEGILDETVEVSEIFSLRGLLRIAVMTQGV